MSVVVSVCLLLFCVFFFFKQKTAYEMRISDWSSDVCSSDLSIFVGAVDPTSGLIIGQPEVKFLGEIDVPSLTIGEGGQRSLSYTAVSVFERLFETDEGARAQDAWHQSIW